MLRYLIAALMLLSLFSCVDEEETLKIKRNIANIQEQIYELERQQVETRRDIQERLKALDAKVSDRTSQADTKDELDTMKQEMSEHWALLQDMERHLVRLENERRRVRVDSGQPTESETSETTAGLPDEPGVTSPPLEVSGDVVQGQYRQAYMDYNRGKYEVAIEGFRGILSSFPNSPYTEKSMYYLGNCLFQTEKYQEARELFSAIAKTDKGDFSKQAMYYEGRCYYSLNQLSKAIITLRDLIAKYPGTQEADLASNFLKQTGYER